MGSGDEWISLTKQDGGLATVRKSQISSVRFDDGDIAIVRISNAGDSFFVVSWDEGNRIRALIQQ